MSATRGGENGLLLEIDTDKLDHDKLVADEDAIEQASRNFDSLPSEWSMKQRTIYYRKRAHLYSWETSLKALGTCGYEGTIPSTAITRAAVVAPQLGDQLLWVICDTTISLLAFRFASKRQKAFTHWVLGDQIPEHLKPDIIPLDEKLSYTEYVLPSVNDRASSVRMVDIRRAA